MKKIALFYCCLLTLFSQNSFSQSLEEGKRMIYYERFNSAREILQKVVLADSENEEAIYWLGQAIIRPDESTSKEWNEAKLIYQSKLGIKNKTLLMAGIGHIELLEGKIADARNHFEAALSLSQGKSIPVLNAIGFANGNPDSKNGDAQYAIDKLKQATQIKKFNDPDVWVNLGDAYRKLGDGGNALLSYQAAITLNPKYARAFYRIGRMYQSQGKGQESIYMEQFNAAKDADIKFAPVYSTLFNYYYQTNVNLAAEYFEKWLANSDEDFKTCYYRASLKYAQGLFTDAIGKSNECLASNIENPYYKLFGLRALAYNKLNDSVHAVENYELYFSKETQENITLEDYTNYMKNLAKLPGNQSKIAGVMQKICNMQGNEQDRVKAIKETSKMLEDQKDYNYIANCYKYVLAIKKNCSNLDLYNVAYNYYRAEQLDSSLKYYQQYEEKYPEEMHPFYMSAKIYSIIDSTLEYGLAVPHYDKVIQIGLTDTVKNKSQLMNAYKYLFQYYAIGMKDYTTATTYINKALSLDPTDTESVKFKAMLTSPGKQSSQKPTTPSKGNKKPS